MKQRILSILLCAAMLLSFSAGALADEAAAFTDVREDDWFYDSVAYVTDKGLMRGGGDGCFDPDGATDRAMLATILYRVEGSPEVTADNPFSDVPAGSWYEAAVVWAEANNIVNGVGDGRFDPTATVTREQLATMLYRYARARGFETVTAILFPMDYADAGEISSWATDAMQWAAAAGLITGVTEDTLSPGSDCSRAQVATVFQRLDEKVLALYVPYGSPWYNTMVSGRLPREVPSVKDDLYTYYNYDVLKEHQGEEFTQMSSTSSELSEAIIAAVKDKTRSGHALEQMRIFFEQASDVEKLAEIGFSEVQPYIDRIDAVTSLDALNALLLAEDFPFNPVLNACLGVVDTRENTTVSIYPSFILCDGVLLGGTYYQESDDPDLQQSYNNVLLMLALSTLSDMDLIGVKGEDYSDAFQRVVDFERAYGKYADSSSHYLNAEYGTYTQAVADSMLTLDALCALAPNLPVKELLEKCGKVSSERYNVDAPGWMTALSDMWTEENLDTLKLITKCKVLTETRPYRDQSEAFDVLSILGQAVPDADMLGYNACNSLDTFAQVIAMTYVDTVLGETAKDRMTALAANLVDAYKDLIAGTEWLDEESRTLITEKLDHMTLNILEPASGYFDYSGLELTPTEEGGTLLSNYLKLKQYRQDCERERLGRKSANDQVWFKIRPTEVNAFYDPATNSINIIPGMITSAMYTDDMDDAELIASIGYIVSHEISHGFDFMMSQIDAYGQPRQLFSEQSLKTFLEKCAALAGYLSTIEYTEGKYVLGQNVIAEAVADLSGMQACLELLSKNADSDYDKFFRRVALDWATVMSGGTLNTLYASDTHPLPYLRVNVDLQMFDAIYDQLGVSEGDGMYLAPASRIAIWGPETAETAAAEAEKAA